MAEPCTRTHTHPCARICTSSREPRRVGMGTLKGREPASAQRCLPRASADTCKVQNPVQSGVCCRRLKTPGRPPSLTVAALRFLPEPFCEPVADTHGGLSARLLEPRDSGPGGMPRGRVQGVFSAAREGSSLRLLERQRARQPAGPLALSTR